MADEPVTEARPRLMSTLSGWIAGLTGLVLALTGLFAAWDKLFPNTARAPAAQSATTAAPKADNTVPSQYTGDGGVKLEWNADQTRWELTDADGTYYYDDVTSPDDTQALGYDKTNRAYLRWPIKGGMAEESKDDRASWTPYLKLEPVADPGT